MESLIWEVTDDTVGRGNNENQKNHTAPIISIKSIERKVRGEEPGERIYTNGKSFFEKEGEKDGRRKEGGEKTEREERRKGGKEENKEIDKKGGEREGKKERKKYRDEK